MSNKKKKIQIFIDPYGNTINVWWGNPKDSFISEEADDSWDVIAFNKKRVPIGFEKIGFFPDELDPMRYVKNPMKLLKSGELPVGIKLVGDKKSRS
ncbi:hypothetical protein KKD19_01670 [Patescibacteria group bacterium]|nr:hypothetical protein [Patescibacteria group bacterium]